MPGDKPLTRLVDGAYRLRKYAIAAGSVAAVGGAGTAGAAIMHYDPADLTIDPGQTIYFDIDDSAGGTLASLTYFADADFALSFALDGDSKALPERPTAGQAGAAKKVSNGVAGYDYTYRLSAGDTISSKLYFYGRQYLEYDNKGYWQGGGTGFLGCKWRSFSKVKGDETFYSWAQISYDDASNQITLLDFATESEPDTAIAAGAVPEPSSLLLAAMGASGIAALRRRRQK